MLGRLQLLPFRGKLDLGARNEATSRLGLSMNLYVRKSIRTSCNPVFDHIDHDGHAQRTKMTPLKFNPPESSFSVEREKRESAQNPYIQIH